MNSKWKKIKNDYIDESEFDNTGTLTMYIDAWESDQEDEEGVVIAKLKANKCDPQLVSVYYLDFDAVHDDYAQQVLLDSPNILRDTLLNLMKEED